MKAWFRRNIQFRQCRLLEIRTRGGDLEASALEITNRKTRSVRVHKVSCQAAAISENGGFILAVKNLTVADKHPGGISVAQRLCFHLL